MPGVIYNDIDIQSAKLLAFERRPVMEGPFYCWTEFTLRVRGFFSPAATSWTLPGARQPNVAYGVNPNQGNTGVVIQSNDGSGTPTPFPSYVGPRPIDMAGPIPANVQAGAETAPWTDAVIRHHLLQPRQRLVVQFDELINLLAPALQPEKADGSAYTVDAANGPFPLFVDVAYAPGTKNWLVDFGVRCCLRESDVFQTTARLSALVALSWEMVSELDQDAFEVRVIRGTAKFRADRLALLGTRPDDYLAAIVHPLPLGNDPGNPALFKRVRLNTRVQPDGVTYNYEVVDKQVAFQIVALGFGSPGQGPAPPLNVSRIEAVYTTGVTNPGMEAVGVGMLDDVADAFQFLDPQNLEAHLFSAVPQMIKHGAHSFMSRIPKAFHHFAVRVWGKPGAVRADLAMVGAFVILDRLSVLNILAGRSRFSCTQDLMGKWVEVRLDLECGPITTAVAAGLNAAQIIGGNNLGVIFLGNEEITNVTDGKGVFLPTDTLPNDPIPGAPLADGVRGTYLDGIEGPPVPANYLDQNNWNPPNPREPRRYKDANQNGNFDGQ